MFSLVNEPWIPALYEDGTFRNISLLESFQDARKIIAVTAENEFQTLAIHRLIFAITYRSLTDIYLMQKGRGSDVKMWEVLWNDNETNLLDLVTNYLGKYESRFHLFDSSRPFFQIPNLEYFDDGDEAKSTYRDRRALGRIMPDMDRVNVFNNSLFAPSVDYAQAARILLTYQSFSTTTTLSPVKGMFPDDMMVSRIYQGGHRGWCSSFAAFTITGATHYETILLNLVPSLIRKDDKPFWELSHPRYKADMFEFDEHGRPTRVRNHHPAKGPVQLMTWFSKGVFLLREGEFVTGAIASDYASLPLSYDIPEARLYELQAAWITTPKGRIQAYAPSERNAIYALEMVIPEPKESVQNPHNIQWIAKVANITGMHISSRILMSVPTFDDKAQTFRGEHHVNLPITDMRILGNPAKRTEVYGIAESVAGIIAKVGSFLRVQAILRSEKDPGSYVARAISAFRKLAESGLFSLLRQATIELDLRLAGELYIATLSQQACQFAAARATQAPVEHLIGRLATVRDKKGVEGNQMVSLASALSNLETKLGYVHPTDIVAVEVAKRIGSAIQMTTNGSKSANRFGTKTTSHFDEDDAHKVANLVFSLWYDRPRSKGGGKSHKPGAKLAAVIVEKGLLSDSRFMNFLRSSNPFEAKGSGRIVLSYLSASAIPVDYIDVAKHIHGLAQSPSHRVRLCQDIARHARYSNHNLT